MQVLVLQLPVLVLVLVLVLAPMLVLLPFVQSPTAETIKPQLIVMTAEVQPMQEANKSP